MTNKNRKSWSNLTDAAVLKLAARARLLPTPANLITPGIELDAERRREWQQILFERARLIDVKGPEGVLGERFVQTGMEWDTLRGRMEPTGYSQPVKGSDYGPLDWVSEVLALGEPA